MKIVIFKSKKQFYFHILARNGKIVAQSEGYYRMASVYKAVRAIMYGMAKVRVIDKVRGDK